MYSVATCEDEKIYRAVNEEICREILKKLNIEYQISMFENSMDLWAAFINEPGRYDLILLDIVMDKMNGIELARKIRKQDGDVSVIFITSNPDFALQGYDVNALHYLMKPLDSSALERLITSDYNRRYQHYFFVFKTGAQILRIPIYKIISLETVGRRVEITMQEQTLYYSGKLSEALEKLPKGQFVRCHQAFAVNISNIYELKRQSAIAVNGKEVPVSRTYAKEMQKAFLKQMRDL